MPNYSQTLLPNRTPGYAAQAGPPNGTITILKTRSPSIITPIGEDTDAELAQLQTLVSGASDFQSWVAARNIYKSFTIIYILRGLSGYSDSKLTQFWKKVLGWAAIEEEALAEYQEILGKYENKRGDVSEISMMRVTKKQAAVFRHHPSRGSRCQYHHNLINCAFIYVVAPLIFLIKIVLCLTKALTSGGLIALALLMSFTAPGDNPIDVMSKHHLLRAAAIALGVINFIDTLYTRAPKMWGIEPALLNQLPGCGLSPTIRLTDTCWTKTGKYCCGTKHLGRELLVRIPQVIGLLGVLFDTLNAYQTGAVLAGITSFSFFNNLAIKLLFAAAAFISCFGFFFSGIESLVIELMVILQDIKNKFSNAKDSEKCCIIVTIIAAIVSGLVCTISASAIFLLQFTHVSRIIDVPWFVYILWPLKAGKIVLTFTNYCIKLINMFLQDENSCSSQNSLSRYWRTRGVPCGPNMCITRFFWMLINLLPRILNIISCGVIATFSELKLPFVATVFHSVSGSPPLANNPISNLAGYTIAPFVAILGLIALWMFSEAKPSWEWFQDNDKADADIEEGSGRESNGTGEADIEDQGFNPSGAVATRPIQSPRSSGPTYAHSWTNAGFISPKRSSRHRSRSSTATGLPDLLV